MTRLISLCLICISFIIPSQALAAWVEAKSENFIFYGDVSEKRAEKILTELEEYRTIIFTFYGQMPEAEPVPVRIYATKSSRDIQEMTGSENAAGVYATRREAPLFILNIKGGFSDKSQAKTIALHEYTHHLLSLYTNQMYPRWVNEGMAEYLSTFSASDKGVIKIGLPRDGRAYALAAYEWMDWDILTGSIQRYPYQGISGRNLEIVQSLFYAQSWLAVHYMISHPDFSDKLNLYVEGVPRATDAKLYFTEVFGMSPNEFGEIARAYYKKNSYPGKRITLKEGLAKKTVTVRKITKAERDFHKGEAVRQFRIQEKEGRANALDYYEKAEDALENDPRLGAQIAASRALVLSAAEESEAAQEQMERALSLDPENPRVLHAAAKVAYGRYQDQSVASTTDDMIATRKAFKAALRAKPDNMQAHFDYVMTYVETGDPPSKQAVYSAVECTYYYRASDLFGENMMLIPVLMRGDERDAARYHMQRAALWAPNARARSQARRMLEDLE